MIEEFNKVPCKYWSNTTKISFLQRRIIVYSIMYYEKDESCVSDAYYDELSHELVRLQNLASEEEFKASTYYYAMYDFDGSTGFDIPSRLNEYDLRYLTDLAYKVYSNWTKSKK